MPPKKKQKPEKPPSWVASTAAPPKVKVPNVKVLNQITSSDLKGIFFTVEGIDQTHFDKLATKNFSSWEDVRTTRRTRCSLACNSSAMARGTSIECRER